VFLRIDSSVFLDSVRLEMRTQPIPPALDMRQRPDEHRSEHQMSDCKTLRRHCACDHVRITLI
jgi:hypothetical protein